MYNSLCSCGEGEGKNTLAYVVSLAKVINLFTKEMITLSSVPKRDILQCSRI